MEHHPSGGSPFRNGVPRYLLVREFLNARVSETKLLCHSLKRKLGEDLFGSSAVSGKSTRLSGKKMEKPEKTCEDARSYEIACYGVRRTGSHGIAWVDGAAPDLSGEVK